MAAYGHQAIQNKYDNNNNNGYNINNNNNDGYHNNNNNNNIGHSRISESNSHSPLAYKDYLK